MSDKGSSVGVNVDVDTLGISQLLGGIVSGTSDREGFVKNLMETAFQAGSRRYNVMVFNLGQNYSQNFQGIKFYGSASYSTGFNTITYGIWLFESGSFTNQGDGGWINWAAEGNLTRNGMTMSFQPISG